MKRFFEFLYPERTHLRAVIAALIAIFMLSGVLAYLVHVSERDRKAQQERQLQSHAFGAADELTRGVSVNLHPALEYAFADAIKAVRAGVPFEEARASVRPSGFCYTCQQISAVATVHDIDLARSDSSAALPAAMLREIEAASAGGLAEFWTGGMFVSAATGTPQVVAFARNMQDGHDRGWVVLLPAEYATHSIAMIRDTALLISRQLIEPVSHDSAERVIFRIEFSTPKLATVASTTEAAVSEPAVVVQSDHIFPGTRWSVGVLPLGREVLLPPESRFLSPNLLILLMFLIAGVIAMAIAVVRREEELHRLRSDLISGVSHELRTPLAQIRMFAETLLLGRTRTEAERRRSLEVIDQEAKRLSHFVENMLQFAKGEGGRARLAPEPSSFAVEIRRAVESFAPMCQARGVEVRAELEDGVTAPVDRAALRRIMLNLMENALKYGPDEQRITVGTALFNDVVRVWVDDEGEGIPRMDREKVFESFFRLNRDLDRRVTGSGIGLAVVRQLALLHGGRAWAEEAPGGGARLVVEFPDAYVRPPEEGSAWAVA